MALAVIFGSAFVIALSGAVMPGPLLTVTIAECLTRGWRAAVWLITGHALLELTLVILLLLGLKQVVGQPLVLRTVAVAGGAVLVWMGVGAWRAGARNALNLAPSVMPDAPESTVQTSAVPRLVAAGALVSLANPYWVVWWATIGVFYMLGTLEHGRAGVSAFFLGHISGDYAWYVFVGVLFAAGRRWLGPRPLRLLFGACALVLGGFGALFLLTGLGLVGDLGAFAVAASR